MILVVGDMGLSVMCLRVVVVEMLLLMVANTALATTQLPQAKPDCPTKCGDVEIPYPFGTKPDCYLDETFLITCNNTSNPHKPFYWTSNLRVSNITMEGLLQFQVRVAKDCYIEKDNFKRTNLSVGYSTSISDTQNKFTVVGCNSYGYIKGKINGKNYTEGCISKCDSLEDDLERSCSGSGCCQIGIPKGLQQIRVEAYTFDTSIHKNVLKIPNPCSYAFVIEESKFNFSVKNLFNMPERVPIAVDWAITGQGKCEEAMKNPSYACNQNASCYELPAANNRADGYLCRCKDGYQGNPYLPEDGCQDIDECKENNHQCHEKAHCVNIPGNYMCKCVKGYQGDGRKDGEGCQDIDECRENPCHKNAYCSNNQGNFTCKCISGYRGDGSKDGEGCIPNHSVTKLVIGIGLGFVIFFVGSSWLYFMFRKRRLIKLKERFFQQNGGFLLQQELSKRNGSSDTAKIFSAEELKKATNNFDEKSIIGDGGYGTVYKGYLMDNNPVAIKKSKIVDQSQIEQFINEVTILSQINHRNVVKLLGCCLETEVPLLVYEYITNGTLFDHIHNKDKTLTILWETRLRIAAEIAGALSYLHSATTTPIIHRDVKSTNILLDDTFIAKVSDFGASKLVPMDVTELSTMVQGTLGYLDPEYLHTSQLTEKSDVYSFGVVLVELMTGKMVLSFDRPEVERSLVMYFLSSLKKGSFFEILENCIVNDDNMEQIREVAELARRCLKVKGEERPTMEEVAMELKGLRRMKKHLWDNVEVNIEETKHLLSETSYACNDDVGNNSTTMYDSIKSHILVAIDDGR